MARYNIMLILLFQFQMVRLKVSVPPHDLDVAATFQFQMVRLKDVEKATTNKYLDISIPDGSIKRYS